MSPLTAHGRVPVWVSVSVDADRAHVAAALPVLVTSIRVDLDTGALMVLQRKYSMHMHYKVLKQFTITSPWNFVLNS